MFADRLDLHQRHAGDGSGTGIDSFPIALAYGTRFTGKHGFVQLQAPCTHDLSIGGHLFSRTDPHEIAKHDFVMRHFDVHLVATHQIIRSDENRQSVKRTLRLKLGDDADAGVDDDHKTENGILPGPGNEHHEHGRENDAVEQREHIRTDDVDQGARGRRLDGIGLPAVFQGLDFGGRQTRLADRGHGRTCTHACQPTVPDLSMPDFPVKAR